jgi:hypothetical protein
MIPASWYGNIGTFCLKRLFCNMIAIQNERGQIEVVVFARSNFHLQQAIPAIEYGIKQSQQEDTDELDSQQVDKNNEP